MWFTFGAHTWSKPLWGLCLKSVLWDFFTFFFYFHLLSQLVNCVSFLLWKGWHSFTEQCYMRWSGMMGLSGSNVNMGMLPSNLVFALFLSVQMTQSLVYLSRSQVTPFWRQHSGEYKDSYHNRHILVLGGVELIFFLVAGAVLCFWCENYVFWWFGVRIKLITHWFFFSCC